MYLNCATCVSLLEAWLARSGQYPLHIHLNTNRDRDGYDNAEVESRLRQVMGVLSTELRRLAIIQYRGPVQHFRAFDVFRGGNSAVHTAEIIITFPVDESRISGLTEFLACCPQLRRVSIVCHRFMVPVLSTSLPWDQLTQVRVFQCNLPNFIFILKNCPKFTRLCRWQRQRIWW